MKDEVEMEVFRSGDYGVKGRYADSDLQQMADDYRVDLLEAPLTFDHAQSGPAYGWISRLRREGDRLVAVLKGVPDAVRELVRNGAYKRRSVELFQKLPQTGRPYIRAVSLLGAATPEVKGLRDVCFSATTDCCAVQFSNSAAESVRSEPGQPALLTGQLERLQQQVRDAQFTALFSELRADGYRLGQRDADAIRQFFAASSSDATVHFDGSEVSGLDWLAAFLRQGLLRVPAGQAASPASVSAPVPGSAVEFSQRTDPGSLSLHQRALVLQGDSPGLSYREALVRASRG